MPHINSYALIHKLLLVSSLINITVDTRTKIQFIYLNNFKKLMTDAAYTTLKSKDKEYRESDVQGLYMRITPKDNKSWQY